MKVKSLIALFILLTATSLAGTRYETDSIQFGGPVIHTNTVTILHPTATNNPVDLNYMTNYISTNVLFSTNTGQFVISASKTNNGAITMNGNTWQLRKPIFYSTNFGFSATANLSLYSSTNLFGCNEQWRSSVLFSSVNTTNNLLLATNTIVVSDGTAFSTLATPFQIVIVDGTSTECVTVTNLTANTLYCDGVTKYTHAATNAISHAVSLNVPGFMNDDDLLNILRVYIQFSAAQTVSINYSIPYIRVK